MVTIKPGFEKNILEDLILKVASTPEEGDLLADFNETIHGEGTGEYVKRVYDTHPQKKEILWFYIKDNKLDEIISSAALIPSKWKIDNHLIDVAEMAFVGTKENHRGQGLFGILNDYYEAAAEERKFNISALDGIPNYYRKFGYVFALERYSGYAIPTNNISQENIENVKIRKATEDDLEAIEKHYNQYYKDLIVSTNFDSENIKFRFMNSTCDMFNSITYIVEEERKTQGFFTIGSLIDQDQADIILSSEFTYNQMIKSLQFVKTYNRGTIDSFIVNVHSSDKFARYLLSKDAVLSHSWFWQIKILDMSLFFEQFTPILEDRIEKSIFKGLNRTVSISNYSDTFSIIFENGKITNIEVSKEFPSSKIDLRIPNPYYIRLFLSDRNVREIKHIIEDTLVNPDSELLIETLFPNLPSIPFSYI